MDKELKQPISEFTGSSDYNALMFAIENTIKGIVNTAIPCVVTSVERTAEGGGAGIVSAMPLVMQRDAQGNTLSGVSIPKLRYFRYQHGTAAIICDPKVGDTGLAVFAQQDCSLVNGDGEPKAPASFRCFDQSDGFFFGGLFGKTPQTYIKIEDTGEVEIIAPNSVTIKTESATVEATTVNVTAQTITMEAAQSITLDTPQTTITGAFSAGGSKGQGGSVQGSLEVSQDVTAGSISLQNHTHGGVQSGGSSTGGPQ